MNENEITRKVQDLQNIQENIRGNIRHISGARIENSWMICLLLIPFVILGFSLFFMEYFWLIWGIAGMIFGVLFLLLYGVGFEFFYEIRKNMRHISLYKKVLKEDKKRKNEIQKELCI